MDQVDFKALTDLLRSNASLNRATRDTAAHLLDFLHSTLALEEVDYRRQHRRGRAPAIATWVQVMTAAALKERFGVTLDAAIAAAMPRGNASESERFMQAFRSLRRGQVPEVVRRMTLEQEIALAAARLAKDPAKPKASSP